MSAVFVVDTRYMRWSDSSFRLTVKRDSPHTLTVKRDSPQTLTMTHREDE